MKNIKNYITTKKTAEMLGVTAPTVRKWAHEGKIPHTVNPMNSSLLFNPNDIEQILNDIKNGFTKTK